MQIAHRLEIVGCGIDGCSDRPRIEFGANEGRYIQPQGPVADAADAECRIEAAPVLVERDLGGGCDKGKIRAAGADLEKADADARLRPDREPDRADRSEEHTSEPQSPGKFVCP